MPGSIKALRLHNLLIGGGLTGAQLETELGNARNAGAFEASLRQRTVVGNLKASAAALPSLAASAIALNAVFRQDMTVLDTVLASSSYASPLAGNTAALNAVIANPTALAKLAASSTAMTQMAASATAMGVIAASATAMTEIANSSTAMTAIAASATAMNAVTPSNNAMTKIAASATAMGVVTASSSAMTSIAASAAAIAIVAGSATAMSAIAGSSTAMTAVVASSTAMNAIAANSVAKMACYNSDTALNAIAGSTTAMASLRAAAQYSTKSATENGTTAVNLSWVGTYIVLGASRATSTARNVTLSTVRAGSGISGTIAMNGTGDALAQDVDVAIPLSAATNFVLSASGTGAIYFGALRCDV